MAESHTFGGHVSAEDEVAAAEGPMESRAWSGRRAACPDGLVLDESHKKNGKFLEKNIERRSRIGRLSTFVRFVF